MQGRRSNKLVKHSRKGYAPLMNKAAQVIDLLVDERGEEPQQPNQTQQKFLKVGRLSMRQFNACYFYSYYDRAYFSESLLCQTLSKLGLPLSAKFNKFEWAFIK